MDGARRKTFEDSALWQRAHKLVLAIYNYSDYFPQKEVQGLTPQLRRAAVAVPTNIAEWLGTEDGAARIRLLDCARRSLEECRYYLILARDLGYGDDPGLMPQLLEVSEMLWRCASAHDSSPDS